MSELERALVFDCRGERLVGVLAAPDAPASHGVVIIVGGPQYRAGSHRAFALLARRLARAGIATLRFDHRGIGDASGDPPSFEDLDADIAAAIDALVRAHPSVGRVVLWGLCDAAAAALLYCEGQRDPRVCGLVLLNPWVRSSVTAARTRLRHYYARRLLAPEFWAKLLRGRVAIGGAAREVVGDVRATRARSAAAPAAAFQERMAGAWRAFAGPVLLLLSGRDLTAREFIGYAASEPAWRGLLERPNVRRIDLPDADHTFSSAELRARVEECTLAWLREAVAAERA